MILLTIGITGWLMRMTGMWPWHRTHHNNTDLSYEHRFSRKLGMVLVYGQVSGGQGPWYTLGLAEQVALSTAIIGLHNVLIHNGLEIDKRLYRTRTGKRIMRIIETLIQTPSLHRGHHGLGEHGVPLGNYGQTLFVWDVLFGTARYVEDQRPERYGVVTGGEESWYQQLWLPYAHKNKQKEHLEQGITSKS